MIRIKCKRIYEEYEGDDGIRILVDRLWPRGIAKEKAKLDYWLKEVAPSNELRKWFNHDSQRYSDFRKRYEEELGQGTQKEALEELKGIVRDNNGTVTLLYGAKDEEYNQAVILMGILQKEFGLE